MTRTPSSMTRPEVVKGALGLATLGVGSSAVGRRRDRVASVGAGAGGVAAAYFLADRRDVDVFEGRSKIGSAGSSTR